MRDGCNPLELTHHRASPRASLLLLVWPPWLTVTRSPAFYKPTSWCCQGARRKEKNKKETKGWWWGERKSPQFDPPVFLICEVKARAVSVQESGKPLSPTDLQFQCFWQHWCRKPIQQKVRFLTISIFFYHLSSIEYFFYVLRKGDAWARNDLNYGVAAANQLTGWNYL